MSKTEVAINIIEATQDQMPEVAEVFRKSRAVSLSFLPTLHSPNEEVNYFSNVVYPASEVYLAVQATGEEVLGFIVFDREWIHHLYLLPHFCGKGIGEKLLLIAKRDKKKLKLWTFQKNSTARKFYERHGFRAITKTDGSENEEKEPDILMEWSAQPD